MPLHTTANHKIQIGAPLSQCHRFFTAAGEELWVDGWKPHYISPASGRTEQGMVFTTGSGEDYTIWSLVDFDPSVCYSRFSRVTPALRAGFVEISCEAKGEHSTLVDITYSLTALTPKGEKSLEGFEGPAFIAMIDGWKEQIDRVLDVLLRTSIR